MTPETNEDLISDCREIAEALPEGDEQAEKLLRNLIPDYYQFDNPRRQELIAKEMRKWRTKNVWRVEVRSE